VVAEQERLDQQIKLIRADAVAMKNAESLTARIDATVEHLDETNKWLAEMDEFKDLVGDMPSTELRVGYNPVTVPPVMKRTGSHNECRKAFRIKEENDDRSGCRHTVTLRCAGGGLNWPGVGTAGLLTVRAAWEIF